MLNFDKENKITFEQLSDSLQAKFRKIISRNEIDSVYNQLEMCEKALNGVRISFTTNLNTITNPITEKEIAVLNTSGALYIYIYTGNRWLKLPNQDIYYFCKLLQSDNQIITLRAGNKNYTSSVNLKYGTSWSASIKSTSDYYTAGNIIGDTSGIINGTLTISATPAKLIKDFYLDFTVAKNTSSNEYGVKLRWDSSIQPEQAYGNLSPAMFDTVCIKKTSSGYSSDIIFYGHKPIGNMYTTVSISLINGDYADAMVTSLPLSSFGSNGRLRNYGTFTNQYFYDLFKSLKGKKVKLYVHFE